MKITGIPKDAFKGIYDFLDFTSCYKLLTSFVRDACFVEFFEEKKQYLNTASKEIIVSNGSSAVAYSIYSEPRDFIELLFIAIKIGQNDVVSLFINKGLTQCILNQSMNRAINECRTDIVSMFVKAGAIILPGAINFAVRYNRLELIDVIIKAEVTDINEIMHYAVGYRQSDIIKMIIKTGAELDRAMIYAIHLAHIDIVNMFIENGVDTNFTDELRCAIECDNISIIKILIKADANINDSINKATQYKHIQHR